MEHIPSTDSDGTVAIAVPSRDTEKPDPTVTDVTPPVQVNPFTSMGESGVQYQTMKWW
jgi:hypothetical protein